MVKVLIADDNFHFIKGIINSIISKISEVKVDYVATNGKEALEMLAQKSFDLVFLDLQMPTLNGIEVLRKVEELNLLKTPKFLIITGDLQLVSELRENKNVCNVILKSENEENITRKIKEVIDDINYETNLIDAKSKVVSEVCDMGYNIKLVGTKYLIEAIMYIYESNNLSLVDNLEKNVYKVIAYRHKKTIVNVKTNISKSTRTMYGTNTKSTPKNVINNVLAKVSDNLIY